MPPPTCTDGLTAFETGNPAAKKGLVYIFHDESSFHANEGQSVMWAEEGRVPIRPKNQGRGLMVSDFVTEYNGLLELTNEELRHESDSNPSIRKYAREILKFGSGNESYWNSEKFLKQMERAVAIADVKYPSDRFSKVWIFDQSSGHCAFRDDALNVNRMNVNPVGAQPKMRDMVWDGRFRGWCIHTYQPSRVSLDYPGIWGLIQGSRDSYNNPGILS